ncbi:MAG: HD domain-containing protein [Acidobacteria bacterium]|nr:HD domain-containing protein [Acidobacteriota bacterium]
MKRIHLRRVKILHLLLVILIGISVLPLWFYGSKMVSRNQETLQTQENVLQTTTSRSLAREISLYVENTRQRLEDFFQAVVPIASQLDASMFGTDPHMRQVLEDFVNDSPTLLYLTVLNHEARGMQAGAYNAAEDAFLRKALEAAFIAARQGNEYQSDPITILRNKRNEPVIVYARPLKVQNEFRGMVAAVVTLSAILSPLEDIRRAGLEAYIVDSSGRLVAHNNPEGNVPGKDMVGIPIVQKFLAWRGAAHATETSFFNLTANGETIPMLGTYSPVPEVQWAVIVQRKVADAYLTVNEMRNYTRWLGVGVILLSLGIAVAAAKSITRPLDNLTETARAIAQRDFNRRADVGSQIEEVAEVAEVLNSATTEIQQHISDLKMALNENLLKSEENRQLFIDAIQMIAAAVDAKDPYTKGHSKRVSDYSVVLATELGLDEEEVEKIKISATLHDVGKIGVEDRVLKKPGVLTSEEFEIMKRHTVMGFEIVRQVKQLAAMLPGIRSHHEALNGKGYPDGLTGDQIPHMVRIISVADTFDAVTTDRPYQAGLDFPSGLGILRKHAGTRYDPLIVDAMHSAYNKGSLSHYEVRRKTIEAAPQPATT